MTIPVTSGFGGGAYGVDVYGSAESTIPGISYARSLDGYHIEVFFTEDILDDANLVDPSKYTLSAVSGAAPASVLSVSPGVSGDVGFLSAVLVHSGTTLGGVYQLSAVDLQNAFGNNIQDLGTNTAVLITLGDSPGVSVSAPSGDQILFDFDQDLLEESEHSGILQTDSYVIETDYPIQVSVAGLQHPVSGDHSRVLATVSGMTSATYTVEVVPSLVLSYDGDLLPDESPGFSAVEFGTGSSIPGGGLSISKPQGGDYGWRFDDTSGRLVSGSTFRLDILVDLTGVVLDPPLDDLPLLSITVDDGDRAVSVTLERMGGEDFVTLSSGGFSGTVSSPWSGLLVSLSLVRNQRAGTYSLLADHLPVLSVPVSNVDGASVNPPGVEVRILDSYGVSGLILSSVHLTSSNTIFSSSWNFIHSLSSSFVGSSAIARDHIFTTDGPLVKDWGDDTPASTNDVAVRVNGVEVDVSDVNPYTGRIELAVPIPLMPPGQISVEIDYHWMHNPTFEMAGYNTEGSVFNKWDIPNGLQDPVVHTTGLGALDESRFLMKLVYGPVERIKPRLLGHRFIGYEKEYTASFNSPTTLLFNQNPNALKVDTFESFPEGGSGSAVGGDVDGWDPLGLPLVPGGDEAALLADPVGDLSLYRRGVDIPSPSSVVLSTRFRVLDTVPDGVFSGVGFGVHDGKRAWVVGCLVVNGVMHIGLALRLRDLHLLSSWRLGLTRSIKILDAASFLLPTADVPTSLESGDRIQVLSGSQAGVYTVSKYVHRSDGTTVVSLAAWSQFPADPYFWSHDSAEAVFEVDWSSMTAYRAVVNTSEGTFQLFVSGQVSGLALTLDGVSSFPTPAQSPQILDASSGQVFWGSLHRESSSSSEWQSFHYGILPERSFEKSSGRVVSTDATTLPEDDANSPWSLVDDFGRVSLSGSHILLESSSSDPVSVLGYSRSEPILTPSVHVDVDGSFMVEQGTGGFGDAQVSVRDGSREAVLGTILYREDGAATPFRRIITLPSVSLSGVHTPESLGWTFSGTGLDVSVRDQTLIASQTIGESGVWYQDVDTAAISWTDDGGRVLSARLRVDEFSPGSTSGTGIIFGAEVGDGSTNRLVAVTLLSSPQRVALTSDGSPLHEFPFSWNDGEYHVYRVLVDHVSDAVSLLIDDSLVSSVPLSSFDSSTSNTMVFLGSFGVDSEHSVSWDSFYCHMTPPADAKRTLGVWLGGDLSDINNFSIPRLDSSLDPNDSITATVEEMDWRSSIQFRMQRDPEWGVVVRRPDLPDPPFYSPGFATERTEPTSGWISVEYPRLPIRGDAFGSVSWGALNPFSVTIQEWEYIRYHVYGRDPGGAMPSPSGMVFNRYNVITSGELDGDTTPETVQIHPLTPQVVSLKPSGVYASDVFRVLEGDSPVLGWRFDRESQTVFLDSPLSGGQSAVVTVVFSPGRPITSTYLERQPLHDSTYLLNDGTPIFQMDQVGPDTTSVSSGGLVESPSGDFSDNSQYAYLGDIRDENAVYDDMEFITLDDGGELNRLSVMCDHGYPVDVSFSGGTLYTEVFKTPKEAYTGIHGPGFIPQGSSMSGSTSGTLLDSGLQSFYPVLHVSGGGYVQGTLGPGTAVLIQNYPSHGAEFGERSAVNLAVEYGFNIEAVTAGGVDVPLEDDLSLSSLADNTPPTYSLDPSASPDGSAGVSGSALVVVTTPGGDPYVGPWSTFVLSGDNVSHVFGVPPSGTALLVCGGNPVQEESVSHFTVS